MTAPATWPSEQNEIKATSDTGQAAGQAQPRQAQPRQAQPDEEPAHVVIGEMAGLLRDTRVSLLTDGSLLGAITIGVALEAGPAARAAHSGLIGVVNLGLLGGITVCWLASAFLLAWVSRPVLNTLSKLRWVTGAPVDPRPEWVTSRRRAPIRRSGHGSARTYCSARRAWPGTGCSSRTRGPTSPLAASWRGPRSSSSAGDRPGPGSGAVIGPFVSKRHMAHR
jgi:hypothetical protein